MKLFMEITEYLRNSNRKEKYRFYTWGCQHSSFHENLVLCLFWTMCSEKNKTKEAAIKRLETNLYRCCCQYVTCLLSYWHSQTFWYHSHDKSGWLLNWKSSDIRYNWKLFYLRWGEKVQLVKNEEKKCNKNIKVPVEKLMRPLM